MHRKIRINIQEKKEIKPKWGDKYSGKILLEKKLKLRRHKNSVAPTLLLYL